MRDPNPSPWSPALERLGWLDVMDGAVFPGQSEFLWKHLLPGHGHELHKEYRAILSESASCASSAEALAVRGRLRRLLLDLPGALDDFALARALDPDCAWAMAFEGELRACSEPARALPDLDAALERLPTRAPLHVWRGQALWRSGRLREALAESETAAALEPALNAARLLRARVLLDLGEPGAADALSPLIESDPAGSGGYALRSMARAAAGDRAGAVEDAHEAVERSPYNVQPFAVLAGIGEAAGGRLDISQGQVLLEAMRRLEGRPGMTWEDVARANPARAWPLACWGRDLCAGRAVCGAEDSAGLRELAAAQSLSPSPGWIHAWRGHGLATYGRHEEALSALDAAIALDPHYRLAYAWRAEVWEALGQDQRALEDWGSCLGVEGRGSHFLRRARIRLRTGDALGGAQDILRCMALEPDVALIYSGLRPPAAGKTPLPRPTLEQLNASSFCDGALRAAWSGRLELDGGDAAAACASLARAAEADPGLYWARAWRAQALLRLGSFERALAEAEAALRADAGCAPAKAAREAALAALGGALAPAQRRWEIVVDRRVESFAAALALSQGPCCPLADSGYLQRARERLPRSHAAYGLAAAAWAAGGPSQGVAGLLRSKELRGALADFEARGFSAFFESERPLLERMLGSAREWAARMDHRRALDLYLGPGAAAPHRLYVAASPLLHGADGSAAALDGADGVLEIWVAWGHAFPSRSRAAAPLDIAKTMRGAWRVLVEDALARDAAAPRWSAAERAAAAEAVVRRLEAAACGEDCARRFAGAAGAPASPTAAALCALLRSYEGGRSRFAALRDFYPWLSRGLQSAGGR